MQKVGAQAGDKRRIVMAVIADGLSGGEVVTRAKTLQTFWGKRDKKMKEWYEQIKMVDVLAQKNMESFVGNDPRASFNLISSILNQRIPHRIKPDKLSALEVRPAAELSKMFDTIWENVVYEYRQRGRYFFKDIIDFLLATGWYSVFVVPTIDGKAFVAEAWNPVTVYPKWSDILSECAHNFTPGAAAIQRMRARNGWKLSSDPTDNTPIYDYWYVEQSLSHVIVHNSIVVGNDQVKVDTPELLLKRIPIFTFPIGGLPDTGELAKGRRADDWKQDIGQSFIATNENVYKTVNKWWTFMMQILRDTAQPKTFERTSSAKQIVKPEEWNQRGAHFSIGLQDEIGYIAPPGVPVELRSIQLDLEAMEQRGGPSWTMFGSVQQRMTAYAMSQVIATTNQIAKYYHLGIIDLFTDIDNFMYDLIRENNYKPYGIQLPDGLPGGVRMSAAYELRIPGDLTQRATTARILSPEFELSDERIMEYEFPEIENPAEELALIRASKARKHPVYAMLGLTDALTQDAKLLRDAGDTAGAELHEMAAETVKSSIQSLGAQQGAGRQTLPNTQDRVPPAESRDPREVR